MSAAYPLDSTTSVRPRFAPLARAWPLVLALIIIAVLLSGFACSRYGRAAGLSALFLPDMMFAQVDLPVRPVTWVTADPVVEREYIDYGSGGIVADVYRPPDDERHAAVIFSMGAPPLDLDDARLVRLAEDTARAGLVMVVPFSRRLDAELIEPEEVDALAGVYQYLEAQPYVDPERIGYIGVSVGGSLALLAAADARIADRVDFVVSFGGYFDAVETLRAIGSRRLEYNGTEEAWEPDHHTVEVMALQIIHEVSNAGDKRTLCKTFVDAWDARLCGVTAGSGPATALEIAQLTPEGRAAYDLMTGAGAERTDELVEKLPASLTAKLDRLSPARAAGRIGGELFIMHDRGDAFVPYVESRRLRDALAGRDDVHYTEVSLFEHVEPRLSSGGDVIVMDGARLYFRLYQLLLRLL